MPGRLAPQSVEENEAIKTASLDETATLSERDLVTSGNRYFAVTGVTDGPILADVHDRCNRSPPLLRASTRTCRSIHAQRDLNDDRP
jgi:fructose-1,6-bisphosphatase/sedoheptulose 1,7-bisphosphatase-like protein